MKLQSVSYKARHILIKEKIPTRVRIISWATVSSLSSSSSHGQRWRDVIERFEGPSVRGQLLSTLVYDRHSLDVQTKLNWLSATRGLAGLFDYRRIEISANARYVERHGQASTITSNLRLEQLPPTSVNQPSAAPVRHSFTTDG